jgi:hypothetical protein
VVAVTVMMVMVVVVIMMVSGWEMLVSQLPNEKSNGWSSSSPSSQPFLMRALPELRCQCERNQK